MKKSLSFILALVLILSNLMCIVPLAEETGTGELEISSASLQFGANVYLMVAVDYSELYDGYEAAKQKVTVKITLKGGEEITLTPDDYVAQTEGFPATSVGFRLTTLSAKNMADVLTVQAYDNGNKSGEPITYSILEYAVKAKIEYADKELLCAAIDAMLEFGAEAQRSFGYDGDYLLYDENGYVDYGMLVVYGASTRKTFAPVGTQVTPATDVAEPLLYTLSYDRIENNAITVKDGVQKAFYVSADDKTGFSFDANSISGDTVYDNEKKVMTAAKNAPIDMGTGIYCNLQLNKIVEEGKDSVAKFVDLNGERVLDIAADKGWAMTIGTSDTSTTNLLDALGDSESFTISLTVGHKTSGQLASSLRIRGSAYPDVIKFTESGITSVSGTLIAPLEANKLTTIHAVFDRTNETTAFYDGDDLICEEKWNSSLKTVMKQENLRILFYGGTSARSGYIQKILVTKGNIFE